MRIRVRLTRGEIDSKLEERDVEVEVLRREVTRLQGDVKKLSWLADPDKANFMKKSLQHYIEFLKKKTKGN